MERIHLERRRNRADGGYNGKRRAGGWMMMGKVESSSGLRRAATLFVSILVVLSLVACDGGGSSPSSAAGAIGDGTGSPVTIRWFVGLGTGARPEQIAAQEAVRDAFNASHPDVRLELEIVDNEVAFNRLEAEIDAGQAPDIIGPIGIRGSNAFAGKFLDLTPHITATGFDLSAYDSAQVEFWREADGHLTALPFGVFPSFLYYNRKLFDAAGLPYPPHRFGEDYAGEEWTPDALLRTAKLLTLDARGRNATSPAFDPDHIVQWGYHPQFVEDARAQGSLFGPGTFVADDGTAQIPAPWLAEWQWYHQAVWDAHAAPNRREMDSPLLGEGDPFQSGNVAMAFTHLWYAGALRDSAAAADFDIAVVPSYAGAVTSKLHADTFRILASTPHPAQAFEVLAYLLDDAAPALLDLYGSLPARTDLRGAFFAGLNQDFRQGVDWKVAEDSLAHPDVPSHEGPMPNVTAAEARIDVFEKRILSDPIMDVAVEAERLRVDLDAIFARR
jgi:multiple sugar transport system substrate-binding protein